MKIVFKHSPTIYTLISLVLLNLKISAQEAVFVHTDKSDYISGEMIQFKAYLLDINKHGISDNSKILYFQLTGPGKIEISGLRTHVENGVCNGQIKLADSLKTGLYYFSAYTNCMRNYPVQTIFDKKILIINQNDEKLDSIEDFSFVNNKIEGNNDFTGQSTTDKLCSIYTDKNIYSTREKIKLKIKIDSLINKLGYTSLSVSIAEQSPFEDSTATSSLINYLNLLNYKWSKLKQENNFNSGKFLTEKNAYIFSGRVLNKTDKKPLSNATVLLSTPDSISNLQYYTTGTDGTFYFQLKNFYDNKFLFLQVKDSVSANTDYTFKIDERKIIRPTFPNSNLSLSFWERNYIEKEKKIALVNKIYIHKAKSLNNENGDSLKLNFYGIPDRIVLPSDYEDLVNFNEMTQNYVWGVKLKKNAGKYMLNMMDYEKKELMEKNALLLINSVPVFSFDVLEPMNTSTIQMIDLKYKHILYGNMNFYGIFSIHVNQKLASEIFSKLQIPFFSNKVMQENLPVNTGINPTNKIPDFRQVLYWNPEIKPNEGDETVIELNASDLKTKYVIQVHGITADNVPVYAKSYIEVK